MNWKQSIVLGMLTSVSAFSIADHQTENVWTSNGDEFLDQNAACANIEDPPNSTNVTYSVWRADPANLSGCERDREQCRNTFNGSLTAIAGCGDDQFEVIETTIQLTTVGYFTRIQEHDDPVSCELSEGNETNYQFSTFLDGDAPDLSGLACFNGCSQNVQVDIETEYEDFGSGWEPSVEHYNITQTGTGVECDSSALPDPPTTADGVGEPPADENCTSDYYTSPVTGAVVCGTPPQTSTDDNGTETTTETAPDGTQTTTTETPDGTTTTTTSFPDGSSTTTTTGPDGSSQTDYDSEGSQTDDDDDCPSNMYTLQGGSLVCNNPTNDDNDGEVSGGGSCDTEPTCSGDPIQCALLTQAWQTRCNVELPTETEILAETGLTEFTPEALDDGEILIDSAFDESGFLTGSDCPEAYAVNVAGVALEFSWEPYCQFSQYIGVFVILAGFLTSTKIVVGAL